MSQLQKLDVGQTSIDKNQLDIVPIFTELNLVVYINHIYYKYRSEKKGNLTLKNARKGTQ